MSEKSYSCLLGHNFINCNLPEPFLRLRVARSFSQRAIPHSFEKCLLYCLDVRDQDGSMKSKPKLLDVVALTEDLPDRKLWQGQVGTLVEVLAQDVFEIEFC